MNKAELLNELKRASSYCEQQRANRYRHPELYTDLPIPYWNGRLVSYAIAISLAELLESK